MLVIKNAKQSCPDTDNKQMIPIRVQAVEVEHNLRQRSSGIWKPETLQLPLVITQRSVRTAGGYEDN